MSARKAATKPNSRCAVDKGLHHFLVQRMRIGSRKDSSSKQAEAGLPPGVTISADAPAWRLRQDDVEGARLFSNRVQLLGALPKGGVVCEVGTFKGHFAR